MYLFAYCIKHDIPYHIPHNTALSRYDKNQDKLLDFGGSSISRVLAIFATVTRTFCGRWITGDHWHWIPCRFTHETYPFHIPEMWISQWLDGLFHGKSEHQMDENGGNIPSSKGFT